MCPTLRDYDIDILSVYFKEPIFATIPTKQVASEMGVFILHVGQTWLYWGFAKKPRNSLDSVFQNLNFHLRFL